MEKNAKRLISVLIMCAMMVMLAACGGDKQESATCTTVQDGVSIEVKIDATNDIITKWTQTSTISTEGYDEETLAYFDDVIEATKEIYAAYDKVDYNMTKTSDSLVETITIDMTDSATIKNLASAGLLPVEGSTDKLSLKLTVESLKSSGWTVE